MERLVEEKTVGEYSVRVIAVKLPKGEHFYAAAKPAEDEWCYLADSRQSEEVDLAIEALLSDETTSQIFDRCAALMGAPWSEGEMVHLLREQERLGKQMMRRSPDALQAPLEDLRKMRDEAAVELSD